MQNNFTGVSPLHDRQKNKVKKILHARTKNTTVEYEVQWSVYSLYQCKISTDLQTNNIHITSVADNFIEITLLNK